MFLRAARHAELDLMTGVSSNIMCGQEGSFGTKAFQIILDHSKIAKMAGKKLKEEEQLDDKLFGNSKNDYCQNISINDTAAYIQEKDTGDIDDEYDPGF